jgi:putative nucleotidyltransferase with HDIG domain
VTTEGLTDADVPEDVIAALLAIVEGIQADALRTGDHSVNVANYAVAMGEELGLDAAHLRRVRRTAILHDIGKTTVPAGILSKPGPLTDWERIVIERHAVAGADMLRLAGLEDEARTVRAHHERYDGRGYPDGLEGEDIPLEARIVFVADSFESMTSDRPYRNGMSVAEARAELRRCAGTQFDPVVVAAFERLLDEARVPVCALRLSDVRSAPWALAWA